MPRLDGSRRFGGAAVLTGLAVLALIGSGGAVAQPTTADMRARFDRAFQPPPIRFPAERQAVHAPPLPRPKPSAAGQPAPTGTGIGSVVPKPSAAAAPVNLATVNPGTAPLPPKSPAINNACLATLTALGVELTRIGPIREGPCGIEDGVKVSRVYTGRVTVGLTPAAQVTCETAQQFAQWLTSTVQPAARQALGGSVTGVRVAASYACRNRNSNPNGKLSEHALGHALDISSFRIDGGRWVTVGAAENGPAERQFLATVRRAACGPFKTVLGPGADEFHTDHFHLDMAERRNGSTFCQ